jgi:DNA-binding CsgD family transcriptional regulator
VKKNDSAGGPLLAKVVPESDPAYPVIEAILRVVPASRWAFARVTPDGELVMLLDSQGNKGGLAPLQNEFERQGGTAKAGARIAATLGPLGDFASGITLLFADAHANFGILTLLRKDELGPFTSSEISVLTLALDATSDRLSALRLSADEEALNAPPPPRSSGESFYVLDSDLQIVLAWSAQDQRRIALTGLRTRLADRLPAVLEETVRSLVAGWSSDSATQEVGVARPVPFLVVRTQPMSGPAGLFIGVRIDRFAPSHSLAGPAARFRITPRELQVLALLLDGAKLEEIGQKLHITSSTIQDHIKSMVDKTESRNRTELIARVLGWERTPLG